VTIKPHRRIKPQIRISSFSLEPGGAGEPEPHHLASTKFPRLFHTFNQPCSKILPSYGDNNNLQTCTKPPHYFPPQIMIIHNSNYTRRRQDCLLCLHPEIKSTRSTRRRHLPCPDTAPRRLSSTPQVYNKHKHKPTRRRSRSSEPILCFLTIASGQLSFKKRAV
jgi:hypothetical protein